MGSSPEQVRKLVEGDAELVVLVREALANTHGGDRRSDDFKVGNTNLKKPEPKNTKSYTLDRLRTHGKR